MINTVPFVDSIRKVEISDDATTLLATKINEVGDPYLYIYNFKEMQLNDSIHLEEGYGPYKMTNLPGLIKISPDNSRILTITGYMDWQIFPGATVYYVFDTKTKDTILNYIGNLSCQEIISSDWKYLYVAEGKKSDIVFNKISMDNPENKSSFQIYGAIAGRIFISDNNNYIIFDTPNYNLPAKVIDLKNYKEISSNGLPNRIDVWFINQIRDGFIFFAGNKLTCFSSKNTYLSGIGNVENQNDTIYPNPTSNIIAINNIITAGKTFKMTNISGSEIPILDKMQITDNGISIDMSSLISGTYYLNISDKTSSKTYKIAKI